MISYQLSVSAQNQPGALAQLTKVLAQEKISIRATTITTYGNKGVVNLIVDDSKQALKALQKAGMEVSMKDVLAILMDDSPGGLNKFTQLFFENGININDAYGFVLESHKSAVFVVDVDDIKKAETLVEKNGFKTLDTDALCAVEPFHYGKY
ncbi:MAG: ACT domain-containing protein [Deltaproteobacteria bacterium]